MTTDNSTSRTRLAGDDAGIAPDAMTETKRREGLDDKTGQTSTRQTFTISDLAKEFEITPRAIRFYEARGLLEPQRRGSQRIYSRRDRGRLILIIRGKNLGFSLEDVSEYLALYETDPTLSAQATLLLEKVNDHLGRLLAKRADLDRTIAELVDIQGKCETHLARVATTGGPSGTE